jgi:hypothetical protein
MTKKEEQAKMKAKKAKFESILTWDKRISSFSHFASSSAMFRKCFSKFKLINNDIYF